MADDENKGASPAPAPATEKAAPPPAAQTVAGTSKAERIERAVERWVAEHLRNSPLARATPAWNYLQKRLDALKAIIEQEV